MSKPPQVNLKDRIAALQQRNAGSPAPTAPTSLSTGQPRSLKDKISQFEQKGGVPIPRGSFGLGAPPIADGQKSRELYGNRIPTPVRITGNAGNGPNSARIGSPMSFAQPSPLTSRKLSLSAAELDDFPDGSPNSDLFSNYRALSPQNTGGSALLLTPQHTGSAFLESLPRGTAFATALEKARKLESGSVDALSEARHTREGSVSPKSLPQSRYLFAQNTGESVTSENMPDVVVSGVQVSERRRSYLMPIADINDTIPLSPEPDFDPSMAGPPIIQVTSDPTPIASEEDAPPLSAFEIQPSYHDHADILPTVTCSDCNAQVPLTELGDHHCDPPVSPLPLSPLPPASPLPVFEEPREPEPPFVHPAEEYNELLPSEVVEEAHGDPARKSGVRLSVEAVISAAELQALRDALLLSPVPQLESVEEVQELETLPDTVEDLTPGAVTVESLEDMITPAVTVEPFENMIPPVVIVESLEDMIPKAATVEPLEDIIPPVVIVESLEDITPPAEPLEDMIPKAATVESLEDIIPPVVIVESLEDMIPPAVTVESPQDMVSQAAIVESPKVESPREVLQSVIQFVELPVVQPQVEQPVEISHPPITIEEPCDVFESPVVSPATPRPQRSPSQKSLPLRPVSMIVESPTRPSDPARSPFFIPSSYAPEHPKLPATSPEETEFGTITFHRSTYSLSRSDNFASHFTEPNQPVNASTFSAVVHGKVTELPANVGHLPMSPQVAKRHQAIRDSIPVTPATGDLASLLANAALLERRLMDGELPAEIPYQAPLEQAANVEALRGVVLVEGSDRWKPVEHIKPEETKPRRKPSFRNPLSRSKSAKDSASVPQVDDFFNGRARTTSTSQSQASHARAVSTYQPLPSSSVETHTRAHSQGSQLTMRTSQTTEAPSAPPTPPPKSPHAKYLSGLRRFTGAYPRHSVSTSSEISSEDSMLVVTPPNRSPDLFANSSSGQGPEAGGAIGYAGISSGAPSKTGITWPSLSTKKSIGNLGKILSRKRSKSNSSVASTADMAERLAIESLNEPLPHSFDIPRVPPLPQVIPPTAVPSSRPNAPLRSKSLHATPTPKEEHMPMPGLTIKTLANDKSTSLLAPPSELTTVVKARPSSWVSISTTSSSLTTGTNPSPLFDMFDAFPAVPDSPPVPSPPGIKRPMSSFTALATAVPRSAAAVEPSPSTATMHNFPSSRHISYVPTQ